jgi:Ca-activated chloride channel family protein
MKKHFIIQLSILAMIFTTLQCNVFANNTREVINTYGEIDVVFAVDTSGSRFEGGKGSDPNRIAEEGVGLFIDKLAEAPAGDRVGVVSYTDTANVLRVLAPFQASNTAFDSKEILKQELQSIPLKGSTDIPAGIKQSLKLLADSSQTTRLPMIVLFTDGNNYINPNLSKEDQIQKQNDYVNRTALVINEAKNKELPIYTVGLNVDGKVDQGYLQSIANKTGGKSFIVTDADDLLGIMNQILDHRYGVDSVKLEDVFGNDKPHIREINISDSNIVEASITVMSKKRKPVILKIYDPSGVNVISDSKRTKFIESKKKTYSIIKLFNPQQGIWKLSVQGEKDDTITLSLTKNYDLILKMNPLSKSEFKAGESIEVSGYFETGKEKLNKTSYVGYEASAVVLDDGKEIDRIELETDNGFKGYIKLQDADKTYEVRLVAENNDFKRVSDSQYITTKPVDNNESTNGDGGNGDENDTPWWMYLIYGIAGLVIIIILINICNRIFRGKRFLGTIKFYLRKSDGTETIEEIEELRGDKRKVSLYQVLSEGKLDGVDIAPLKKVYLYPYTDVSIHIYIESTECDMEFKGGDTIPVKQKIVWAENQQVHIKLTSGAKIIMTYRD